MVLIFIKKPSPLVHFTTPIIWWGYILLIDGMIFKLRGNSLICSRTKEFFLILPLSMGFWLIFEGYNLLLKNWQYINLPKELWITYLGYILSFTTILPAILETAELFSNSTRLFKKITIKKKQINTITINLLPIIGTVFLVIPLILPFYYSYYLFILVWIGFIFLFDPINYRLGKRSILGDLEMGNLNRILMWSLAGLICGFFWELWNYWAFTKWIYNVPFFPEVKLFEMPLTGYIGFPLFALEYYTLYNLFFTQKHK